MLSLPFNLHQASSSYPTINSIGIHFSELGTVGSDHMLPINFQQAGVLGPHYFTFPRLPSSQKAEFRFTSGLTPKSSSLDIGCLPAFHWVSYVTPIQAGYQITGEQD